MNVVLDAAARGDGGNLPSTDAAGDRVGATGRGRPAYAVNVSRPEEPWPWTNVLVVPLQLLAVAWTLPAILFLILAPVAIAFWLGRIVLGAF